MRVRDILRKGVKVYSTPREVVYLIFNNSSRGFGYYLLKRHGQKLVKPVLVTEKTLKQIFIRMEYENGKRNRDKNN
jgi:hypothetical protein